MVHFYGNNNIIFDLIGDYSDIEKADLFNTLEAIPVRNDQYIAAVYLDYGDFRNALNRLKVRFSIAYDKKPQKAFEKCLNKFDNMPIDPKTVLVYAFVPNVNFKQVIDPIHDFMMDNYKEARFYWGISTFSKESKSQEFTKVLILFGEDEIIDIEKSCYVAEISQFRSVNIGLGNGIPTISVPRAELFGPFVR